jgi:hypothetical protein
MLLMAEVATAGYFMITKPYVLEDVRDNYGQIVSNPNLVVNPSVKILFMMSLVTGLSLLFSRNPEEDRWYNTAVLVASTLLIAAAFYYWSFNSLAMMSYEKRHKIYYELGGEG